MSPEAREKVLQEHAELRGLLDGVEELAQRFEGGDESVGAELRERGLALYERLAAHIELEERLLVGELRRERPDGRRRAERLAHEHHEQRELLRYLTGRLREGSLPSILVARELQNFAGYLRMDMQHEEETLLSPRPRP